MGLLLGTSLGLGLILVMSSFWPRTVTRLRIRWEPVRRLLDQAGHQRVPVTAFVVAVLGCAVVAFFITLALTSTIAVAGCFGLFGAAAPWALLRWQGAKRQELLADVWPDAVDHLRSAVRSGLSLPEALIGLSTAGPAPLRDHFAEFGRDWRAGQNLDTTMQRLKDRLRDPVADRIIAALAVTREVGGTDLGRVLGTLSDFLRESSRARAELVARQSWTISAAKLGVVAPWAILLLMSTQDAAVQAYSQPAGVVLLIVGIVVSVLCYRLMLRIGKLPTERRVLV